jgi:hypothetical protein
VKPLFPLGQVVDTPAAIASIEKAGQQPGNFSLAMLAATGMNWMRKIWRKTNSRS